MIYHLVQISNRSSTHTYSIECYESTYGAIQVMILYIKKKENRKRMIKVIPSNNCN